MPPTGEEIQALGEQGSLRAKRWLEATCRAEVKWTNPGVGVKKLQYRKAGADPDSQAQDDYYSFDLGGNLLGGSCEGETFLAESKKYATAADQGTHYRKFLAGAYRVQQLHPEHIDNFIWITWAPFLVTTWDTLLEEAYVSTSVNYSDETKRIALEGDDEYDADTGQAVADKTQLVVIGDRQEVSLSLHGAELLHVRKALLELRSI